MTSKFYLEFASSLLENKLMYFPENERKMIENGEADVTIKILKNVGRYEVGKIYQACSYENKSKDPWKVLIKIKSKDHMPLDKAIKKYNFTDKDKNHLLHFRGMEETSPVDVLMFETIKKESGCKESAYVTAAETPARKNVLKVKK